ncbi:hypothetical protein C8Q80DRAFT_1267189 [Daedaleopsis nitida]|nr:hypothetical protein C8Q80DRAFT_1267189 [Daedaleopsis nitida]
MSSLERPSTPQPPVPDQPGGDSDDAERASEIEESRKVNARANQSPLPPADSAFVKIHLNLFPEALLKKIKTVKNKRRIFKMIKARSEESTYKSAAELLTSISATIWELVKSSKETLNLNVNDTPDLLGVFPVANNKTFSWDTVEGGSVAHIPHYRVEALVELKGFENTSKGASQANDHAQQHLRARPDHPGVYSLSMRPQGFHILYTDTSGAHTSEEFLWDRLDILAAFVYSIYDPPQGHILRDPSIWWQSSNPQDPLSPPVWTVTAGGKEYHHGELIFGGHPCGRRTTVIKCPWPENGFHILIKDYYPQLTRRFAENPLVEGIHEDGIAPGVVRFASAEEVKYAGESMTCGTGGEKRIRQRILMPDYGVRLLEAKSVNDLLKAVYDVLEVHRMLVLERKVLHRDMSINNILMYPKWGPFVKKGFINKRPPLIEDVLAGRLREPSSYQANCLLIDFDNSAKLVDGEGPDEMIYRTGTPMYIARSVNAGRVWVPFRNDYLPMPDLSDQARHLYAQVHGMERYNSFQDTEGTMHGGVPPPQGEIPEVQDGFIHKPEYDAESVWWSLLSTGLLVKPVNDQDTPQTSRSLKIQWDVFSKHDIMDTENRDCTYIDNREAVFFHATENQFLASFLPNMQAFGATLYQIARQVAPSYPLMNPPPPQPDHLHEAMQRIILNYLVEHRDKDILLDPKNLRSTDGPGPKWQPAPQPEGSTRPATAESSRSRKRARDVEAAVGERQSKRIAQSKEASLPVEATEGFHYPFKFRAE